MSDKILDGKLICDVMLPPATIIKRGCDLRTLLAAINQRGKFPPEQRVLRDAALAQQPAPAVLDGWKLVPVDATLAMVEALKARIAVTGRGGILNAGNALNDAIAAAPAAPAPVEQTDTVKVPRELLAELRAFTLEYDSGRAGVMRGQIDALLGKGGA